MNKLLFSVIGILLANSTFSQCPPTTPTITGTPVLCNGASGSLSAAGSGDTYTWSPGGANTSSISISPSSTTTYSLVMGQTGCTVTSSAALTVTVANTPTVVASVPSFTSNPGATSFSTCAFDQYFDPFSASGASTYTWSNGATTATTSVFLPFTTSPPSYVKVYKVTGENACGTSTAAITLTLYSTPLAGISPANPVICKGQQITLKAIGPATNYTWTVPGSTTTIATTSSIVVSPTIIAQYYLIVSYGFPCSLQTSVTVTVNTCTGVDELSNEEGVSLYPNPVGEILHVDVSDHQGPGILEVYDATGKILIKETVSGPGNVIHTDALQPGIYFYKVSGKAGKFIKE
jgi:hypothetical protein